MKHMRNKIRPGFDGYVLSPFNGWLDDAFAIGKTVATTVQEAVRQGQVTANQFLAPPAQQYVPPAAQPPQVIYQQAPAEKDNTPLFIAGGVGLLMVLLLSRK